MTSMTPPPVAVVDTIPVVVVVLVLAEVVVTMVSHIH